MNRMLSIYNNNNDCIECGRWERGGGVVSGYRRCFIATAAATTSSTKRLLLLLLSRQRGIYIDNEQAFEFIYCKQKETDMVCAVK